VADPIDLDKLASAIDGFAKTRFRVFVDEYASYDMIQTESDGADDGWSDFAEVQADDCAAPVVEILTAAPELLRLARVGLAYDAYERARSGDDIVRTLYALDAAYRAARESTP
jgi:hypothetical protein